MKNFKCLYNNFTFLNFNKYVFQHSERVKTVDSVENEQQQKEKLKDYIHKDLFKLRVEILNELGIEKLQNLSKEQAAQQLKKDFSGSWRMRSLNNPDAVKLVFCIQKLLQGTNFDCGVIDGLWGNKTREGIESFQRQRMKGGNGVPGPKTVAKMVDVLGGGKTVAEQNLKQPSIVRPIPKKSDETVTTQLPPELSQPIDLKAPPPVQLSPIELQELQKLRQRVKVPPPVKLSPPQLHKPAKSAPKKGCDLNRLSVIFTSKKVKKHLTGF